MPVSYTIEPRLHLVVASCQPPVTYQQLLGFMAALREDPDFEPSMRQLTDARWLLSSYSGDEIRGLARSSPYGEGSRRAIVVSSEAIYGAARMYGAQIRAGKIGVFKSVDDAIAWLDLSPEEFSPGVLASFRPAESPARTA